MRGSETTDEKPFEFDPPGIHGKLWLASPGSAGVPADDEARELMMDHMRDAALCHYDPMEELARMADPGRCPQ